MAPDLVSWLPERSAAALIRALGTVDADLAGRPIELRDWTDTGDERWCRGTAFVDGQWVIKFAWSEPAAHKLVHEARVREALGSDRALPLVARVRVWSRDPAVLITPYVHGDPVTWGWLATLGAGAKRRVADQLAAGLALLHDPSTFGAIAAAGIDLPGPRPQADTATLRSTFADLLDPSRSATVRRWCEWVDRVLAHDLDPVFLHGDFHGFNVVFDAGGRFVQVLDLEEACAGDFHYDLRYLPAQEPSTQLARLTAESYAAATGRAVSMDRVMAWNVLTVCGDALWRTVADVPHYPGWSLETAVDDLVGRFDDLAITPY